jgi:hypothetical protein
MQDGDTDSTESAESAGSAQQRKRGAAARNSKARSSQTEKARRAKLAKFREEAALSAEAEDYWAQHEISQPNFVRQGDAEILYHAAISVMSARREKRKIQARVAQDCCVKFEAITNAIEFLELQEQRQPPGRSDADTKQIERN